MRWGLDQWLITDTFRREWLFRLVALDERVDGVRISRWDMPDEPLFHIIPQGFYDWGARDDETASDLIAIYDALTGSHLSDEVPQPTQDRRRRLRGFEPELRWVLYEALETGVLTIERYEMPWPFPEVEEKPEEKKPEMPVDERPSNFLLRVIDEAGKAVDGIEVVFEARGEKRSISTDGAGKARWDGVRASGASVRLSDVTATLKKLKARYKSPRERRVPEGQQVTCIELGADDPSITLNADVEHTLVLEPPRLELPPQKPQVEIERGDEEPVLLASNDPSFVPSVGAVPGKARELHKKRSEDSTPETNPGGAFFGFHVVTTPARPSIQFDHGFFDDGKGNLDTSKCRSPTAADYFEFAKWDAGVSAMGYLRPDLDRAVRTYHHFLYGKGADYSFSYDAYVEEDRGGARTLESVIEDTRAGAVELHDRVGNGGHEAKTFLMQTDAIPCGDFSDYNERYPYPGTDNWQKAIGAHAIWIEAQVAVQVNPYWYGSGFSEPTRTFTIELTLHAEDRYNFNPGAKDINTQIPDSANGRFELTGLAHEFMNYSTLKRTITFTIPLGPSKDHRADPGNQKVTRHR